MNTSFASARKAVRARAEAQHATLHPLVCQLRHRGLTLDQIAGVLQRLGYKTARGGGWTKIQVWRLQQPPRQF